MTERKNGAAIRAIRLGADLTLQEVADCAGVSISYLSRAETGLVEPSAEWVRGVVFTIGHILVDRSESSALVNSR